MDVSRVFCCLIILTISSGGANAQQQISSQQVTSLLSFPAKIYPGCVTNLDTVYGFFDERGQSITTMGALGFYVFKRSNMLVYNLANSISEAINDRCSLQYDPITITGDFYVKDYYTGLARPTKMCFFSIPFTGPIQSAARTCPNICSHRDSSIGVTSRDACKLPVDSPVNKAWQAMILNQEVPRPTIDALKVVPTVGPCLLQYMGLSRVDKSSACVATIGSFCYRNLCISKTARPRGFHNEGGETGRPALHCIVYDYYTKSRVTVSTNTEPGVYNKKCDSCIFYAMAFTVTGGINIYHTGYEATAIAAMKTNCNKRYFTVWGNADIIRGIVTRPDLMATTVNNLMTALNDVQADGFIWLLGSDVKSQSNIATQVANWLITIKNRMLYQNVDMKIGVLIDGEANDRANKIPVLNVPALEPYLDFFWQKETELLPLTTPSECGFGLKPPCASSANRYTQRDMAETLIDLGVPLQKIGISLSLYGRMYPYGADTCVKNYGGDRTGLVPVDYFFSRGYDLSRRSECNSIDPVTARCEFKDTITPDNCGWITQREGHIDYRVGSLMQYYPSADFILWDTTVSRNGYYIDVVKTAITRRTGQARTELTQGPYYYAGTGPRVACPDIVNFVGEYMVLSRPYAKSVKIPLLTGYLALPGFACEVGDVTPPTTCATSPAEGIDMSTLKLVATSKSAVIWDPLRLCFAVPKPQEFCSFNVSGTTINTNFWQLGAAFTVNPIERDFYWIGLSRYLTFVDSWTTVVDAIPIDIKCINFDINALPDCQTVVCGADISCRQQVAEDCVMDVTTRTSLIGLQQEFYAAMITYQTMMKELYRFNQTEVNPYTGERILGLIALIISVVNSEDIKILKANMQVVKGMVDKHQEMLGVQQTMIQNLRDQLGTQQGQINILNDKISSNSEAISHNADQIIKLGGALMNLSIALDSNIKAVNGRIDLMESEINRRFSSVSDIINQVQASTANQFDAVYRTMNIKSKAAIYFQQLLSFGQTISFNTLKLIRLVENYRQCFQSLNANELAGCPVNQPFIDSKPHFKYYKSVSGVIYRPDLGFAAIMYKVPSVYRDYGVHAVSAKPVVIDNEWYAPRTDDVWLLGDGKFYQTPDCSQTAFCMPPIPHPSWTDCLAALTIKNVGKIRQFCRLTKCTMQNCQDIITSPSKINVNKFFPGMSIGNFTWTPIINPIGPTNSPITPPNFSVAPIKTNATLQEMAPYINGIQGQMVELTTYMNNYTNNLYNLDVAFKTKVEELKKMNTQFDMMSAQYQNLSSQFDMIASHYYDGPLASEAIAAIFTGDWSNAFTGAGKGLAIAIIIIGVIVGLALLGGLSYFIYKYACAGSSSTPRRKGGYEQVR